MTALNRYRESLQNASRSGNPCDVDCARRYTRLGVALRLLELSENQLDFHQSQNAANARAREARARNESKQKVIASEFLAIANENFISTMAPIWRDQHADILRKRDDEMKGILNLS